MNDYAKNTIPDKQNKDITELYPDIHKKMLPYADEAAGLYASPNGANEESVDKMTRHILTKSNLINNPPYGHNEKTIRDTARGLAIAASAYGGCYDCDDGFCDDGFCDDYYPYPYYYSYPYFGGGFGGGFGRGFGGGRGGFGGGRGGFGGGLGRGFGGGHGGFGGGHGGGHGGGRR
jgi:hypothetical protein